MKLREKWIPIQSMITKFYKATKDYKASRTEVKVFFFRRIRDQLPLCNYFPLTLCLVLHCSWSQKQCIVSILLAYWHPLCPAGKSDMQPFYNISTHLHEHKKELSSAHLHNSRWLVGEQLDFRKACIWRTLLVRRRFTVTVHWINLESRVFLGVHRPKQLEKKSFVKKAVVPYLAVNRFAIRQTWMAFHRRHGRRCEHKE